MIRFEGHTLGPWEVTAVSMETGNVSVGQRDLRIVIAEVTNAASFGDMLAGAMNRGGGQFSQDDCKTQFANARLIAAAPDLAAENERLRAALLELNDALDDGLCSSGTPGFDSGRLGRAQDAARAALAKEPAS